MGDTSLQERLKQHSEAFDSLLSLIPAKLYYGEDSNTTTTQEQWQRKKQSKEEKVLARRAKLDPDSAGNRSAKEVLEDRARNKRKAEALAGDDDDEGDEDRDGSDDAAADDELDAVAVGEGREKPGEGLKRRKLSDVEDDTAAAIDKAAAKDGEKENKPRSEKQQERALKRQQKLEKKAEKRKSKNQGPVAPAEGNGEEADDTKVADKASSARTDITIDKDAPVMTESPAADDESTANHDRLSHVSTPMSPVFDNIAGSSSSSTSISSTTDTPPERSSKAIRVPSDTTALRARLAARISALRAARKADGPDGKPIRTREELIESRRKKETQRKAHKLELKKQAKEAEAAKREEALANARNSPMMLGSPGGGGGGGAASEHNSFAFGRVAFADGTQMSHDLSYVKDGVGSGKKGPVDPKAALAKLEANKARIAEMEPDKQKQVLEQEQWLTARRRVEGTKIRDDESLLKKAVKRKEKAKKKSEKEWAERKENVEKSIKQRQDKREANIKSRKDDKLMHKLKIKNKKGKLTGGAAKKKNRAGFEGTGFGKRK